MYREFIINNFGNVHLKGFELLVKACEIYNAGITTMERVYTIIAADYPSVSRYSIERNIRIYIHSFEPHELERHLPHMYIITNKSVVAAIVAEVNKLTAKKAGRHE